MAMPRSAGGSSFIRSPSIATSPALISSSPATMRSNVDLPQPDGPTKTTNSPSSIARSTPWITGTLPKLLATPDRVSRAI